MSLRLRPRILSIALAACTGSILMSGHVLAQGNTWTQKSDIGLPIANGSYPLMYAASFSVGGKGYVVAGSYENQSQAGTWQYDPGVDQWTRKADFPGAARNLTSSFAIGTKGYICLGGYTELWEYDAAADAWTQKAGFPGSARTGACSFVINDMAYISNGYGGGVYHAETWRYDPLTDSWSARAAFPGTARSSGMSFSNNGIGYICGGSSGTTRNDLWAYNPIGDSWVQKANIPIVIRQGVAFTVGNRSFTGTGQNGSPQVALGDWFEYDPATNVWTSRAAQSSRWNAFAFVIGAKGYLGGGSDFAFNVPDGCALSSFGEYDPALNSWTARARMGASPTMAAASFSIGDHGFVLLGGDQSGCAHDSWSYDPSNDSWTRIPFTGPYGLTTGFAVGNTGYQATGYQNTASLSTMRAYDPTTNQVMGKAAFGGGARTLAVAFSIGGKGYLGTGNKPGVGRTRDVWCYDPGTNTWSAIADFGGSARWNATAFTIGGKAYVGLGQDATGFRSDIWRYDPSTNTWTQLPDFPGGAREKATGFAIGSKGFVFGGTVGTASTNDLWAYDAITEQWQIMAAMPAEARISAPAFVIGGTAYVTAGRTSSSNGHLLKDTWAYDSGMVPLAVQVKVFLEGPYESGTGLMDDDLRTQGLIPVAEPHSQNGALLTQGVGTTIASGVLSITGPDAIVDHVVVEIRHPSTPARRLATIPALVQRDGDVVAMDGIAPITFIGSAGNYHVAVRHRNHLGTMTALPIPLSTAPTAIDFTDPSTLTYGTGSRKQVGSKMLMWSGDVTGNGVLAYTGANNDRDPILTAIGGTLPTATLTGQYRQEDVNLDGTVKYVGANNDRDPILVNIGGTTPTNTRVQQLP